MNSGIAAPGILRWWNEERDGESGRKGDGEKR